MSRRNAPKYQPAVERIESRTLLSVAAPAVSDVPIRAEVSPAIYPPPLVVSGLATGSYSVVAGRRGIPPLVNLRGSGDFLRMSPTQVHAQFVGGRSTGRVVLSTTDGMVELELNRTNGRLAAGETSLYEFTVRRATGRYAEFLNTGGVAELTLGRVPRRGAPGFTLGINPILPA